MASSSLLVVLSPLMLGIAVAVKAGSSRPVIFHQERLGRGGRPFFIHKFRSTRVDAEADEVQWVSECDTRVTCVGRILRKTRLYDLPQSWDVVRGDMSLISPRAVRAVFYEESEKYMHGFSKRTLVTLSVLGYDQVMGAMTSIPPRRSSMTSIHKGGGRGDGSEDNPQDPQGDYYA